MRHKTILALILLLLFAVPACALDMSESDKQKHFAVSAGLGLAADSFVYHAVNVRPVYRPVLAFSMAMVPGLAKEAADNRWDNEDIQADALGAFVGVLAAEIINKALGPSKYIKINGSGVYIGGTW